MASKTFQKSLTRMRKFAAAAAAPVQAAIQKGTIIGDGKLINLAQSLDTRLLCSQVATLDSDSSLGVSIVLRTTLQLWRCVRGDQTSGSLMGKQHCPNPIDRRCKKLRFGETHAHCIFVLTPQDALRAYLRWRTNQEYQQLWLTQLG